MRVCVQESVALALLGVDGVLPENVLQSWRLGGMQHGLAPEKGVELFISEAPTDRFGMVDRDGC